MRTVLIYPPLLDPTSPYHSLSYLKAAAVERGYPDTRIVDANIEAIRYVLAPAFVEQTLAERRSRRRTLAATRPDPATAAERAELYKADLVDAGDVQRAVGILTDATEFYDIRAYRWAVDRIVAWMGVVGTLGVPGQFQQGFRLATGAWSASRVADLVDRAAVARLNGPFEPYLRDELLPALRTRPPDVIGLNLTFTSQLPFGLRLLDVLRTELPGTHLVVGGTELSDLYKYLANKSKFFAVFADADSAVIGEGETAFVSLLDQLSGGPGAPGLSALRFNPSRHPGGRRALPVLHHENLREIPTPLFDDIDFDRYLSPHRYVYLSPTRGCYWNRCAFCDYGLNDDGPTSPWRQAPVDRVFAELCRTAEVAPFVYLSVDVLAPAMLHRLAGRIRDAGVDVTWGAEIRLERYWTAEACRDLRSGGCVAVAVGFESASQRVLDAMDKGTRIGDMLRIIGNLADAGIAVQIMAFTGFPGETFEEATQTLSVLAEIHDRWTLGDVGDYVLTAGSFVAKQPDRYGLTGVKPKPGHDIHRSLDYTDPAAPTAAQTRVLDRRKRLIRWADLDRPWLGGVDTPHSYFYHARFGREVGRLLRHDVDVRRLDGCADWRLNGRLVEPPDGTDFARAGGALTLRPSPISRPLLLRRDGAAFRCPNDLVPALPGDRVFDLDPPVDLDRLSMTTRRALLAGRLLVPDPASAVSPPHLEEVGTHERC